MSFAYVYSYLWLYMSCVCLWDVYAYFHVYVLCIWKWGYFLCSFFSCELFCFLIRFLCVSPRPLLQVVLQAVARPYLRKLVERKGLTIGGLPLSLWVLIHSRFYVHRKFLIHHTWLGFNMIPVLCPLLMSVSACLDHSSFCDMSSGSGLIYRKWV